MQEANSDTKFKKGQQDADFFKKLHKVQSCEAEDQKLWRRKLQIHAAAGPNINDALQVPLCQAVRPPHKKYTNIQSLKGLTKPVAYIRINSILNNLEV